jgi:hypothetical protein
LQSRTGHGPEWDRQRPPSSRRRCLRRHLGALPVTIFQDARDVRTKRAKTFTSIFFPVGSDFEAIVGEWVAELKANTFGLDDPLFPSTEVVPGPDRMFEARGLTRNHWKDAGAIRRIFREAFERVGLPYYHPHSFRHTLAVLGEKMHLTPEEWKAYSQNFGHSSAMTTFNSYGPVAPHRQAEILNAMAQSKLGELKQGSQPVTLDENQVNSQSTRASLTLPRSLLADTRLRQRSGRSKSPPGAYYALTSTNALSRINC